MTQDKFVYVLLRTATGEIADAYRLGKTAKKVQMEWEKQLKRKGYPNWKIKIKRMPESEMIRMADVYYIKKEKEKSQKQKVLKGGIVE